MLLQIQRPGLAYAASEYDWRTRFNRTINEDARPLLILWPFGPVAFVYDVQDTQGDALPEDIAQTFHAMGPITEVDIQKAIRGLANRGINVKLIDSGDANAGKIEVKRRSTAKTERPDYQIRLNKNHDRNVQFVTLVHELGHLYLGHLGPDKHLSIDPRGNIDHQQAELEAESLAYPVCKRRGVTSKSESYLAAYATRNVTVGSFDFYLLTKAAGQVETALGIAAHTLFEPKDERNAPAPDADPQDHRNP